jgi:hypothetical protein
MGDRNPGSLAGGIAGTVLEAFCYSSPYVDCHGLYATGLGIMDRRARFSACLRLCEALEAHWSRTYRGRPVLTVDLMTLRKARRSAAGSD